MQNFLKEFNLHLNQQRKDMHEKYNSFNMKIQTTHNENETATQGQDIHLKNSELTK